MGNVAAMRASQMWSSDRDDLPSFGFHISFVKAPCQLDMMSLLILKTMLVEQ